MTRLQNIGDTLAAIPALRTVRQALPDARITWLAKHAGGIEVIRECPYIDDLLVVRNRGLKEKMRLIWEFRRRKIDYFIISPQDLGRVPWAFLGGARNIVGYPRVYNYGSWQNEKLPGLLDISVTYDTSLTEVENCMKPVHDVLDDIGVPLPNGYSLELEYSWYTKDDCAAAEVLLAGHGVEKGRPFIVSAPFSKRPAKNWSEDKLTALFNRLQEQWRMPIVFIGGPEEQPLIDRLGSSLKGAWVNTAGKTTLAQSAVILEHAYMFFGPDSGPAFMASAVKTPAVVLYGPADYYRWRPPLKTVPRTDVYHGVACSPCRHQVCPKSPACMELIDLDEVWNACETIRHEIENALEVTPGIPEQNIQESE